MLTPEQNKRILDAIKSKGIDACPLCSKRELAYGERLILLEVSASPAQVLNVQELYRLRNLPAGQALAPDPPPIIYPSLPLMCQHCGNTVLLNVYRLGIADIWGGSIPPAANA